MGSRPLIKNVNLYKPRKERGDRIYIVKSKAEVIGRAAQDPRKAFCFSDEKATAEDFAEARKESGKTLLATSDTIDSLSTVMSHINDHIKEYDTFSGSPSVGTGVSISEGHGFQVGYGYFGGGNTTAEQNSQQMARFRGMGEYYVAIAERHANLPDSPIKIETAMISEPVAYTQAAIGVNLSGEVVIDGFAKQWTCVQALRNLTRNNLKERQILIWEQEGFEVVDLEEEESFKDIGQEAVEALKEVREEKKERQLTEKAKELQVALGVDEDTASYIAKRDQKQGLLTKGIKGAKIARLTTEEAKQIDKEQLEQVVKGKKSIVQVGHYSATRKLLNRLAKAAGIDMETLTTTGKTWGKDQEKAIKRFMVDANKEHFAFLNITMTSDSKKKPVLWFNKALQKLGVEVVEASRTNKERTFTVSEQSLEVLKLLLSK